MHPQNCFITLTYNDDHVPHGRTLVKHHFQNFMKRLRKHYGKYTVTDGDGNVEEWGIRYYHCGEYGSKHGRPHYHACLFNHDFEDKWLWQSRRGIPLYRSDILESLWSDPVTGQSLGYCSIGEVTIESAAYVARYIMKKVNGAEAEEHYETVDPHTGEISQRLPEYTTMSRRPGIGSTWFDKFGSDVYPSDFIIHKGKRFRPPRYYDTIFELDDPEGMESIKERRRKESAKTNSEKTSKRLKAREKVKRAQTRNLKRSYEDQFNA